MKIQRCKGMRDLTPDEMTMFYYIQGIYRDCFLKWGYQEVRTPTIEYLHLFTSAGTLTPGMLGKVYSFLDWDGWSGERVVLRPDGTIPVARMYADKMQGLARLFYTANVFRFEQSREGNREVWQCGGEIIGAGSAVADAELISLSCEILKKLGVNVEVRLSHAGLIKAIVGKLGLSPEEQHKAFDSILDGDEKTLAEINKKSPGPYESLLPLLNPKGQSVEFLREKQNALCLDIPELKAPLNDFLKTISILDELGIKYQVNIASGGQFEYYTGVIFQFYAGKDKVGGGGRYDALIETMGGSAAPACGFALYLDRLMKLAKRESAPAVAKVSVKISGQNVKEAFSAAAALRKAGFVAEIELDCKKADWILEIKGKAPEYVLSSKSNKTTARSITEVIKAIKVQDGR
jgi:histidyl-tRNA synthetase